MALDDDVRRAGAAAGGLAAPGEVVEAVLPTEPKPGERIYLVAFADGGADLSWVAVDGEGEPITSRDRVREAVSIAAICEVAEEVVPEELLDAPPRLASPQYLDSLGMLQAEGLAGVLQSAAGAVEELARDVEDHYKLELR